MKKLLSVALTALLLTSCGGGNQPTFAERQVEYAVAATTNSPAKDPTLVSISNDKELWHFRIRGYIDQIMSFSGWSIEQRASNIHWAAVWNNVTREELVEATGYTRDDVDWYLSHGDTKNFHAPTKEEELSIYPKLDSLNIKDVGKDKEFTITGKWLNGVKTVYFNGRALHAPKRGYWSMVLVMDAAYECGALEAELYGKPLKEDRVTFGFYGVTGKCDGEITHLRVAQSLVTVSELVNGKGLGVQAVLKANEHLLPLTVEVLDATGKSVWSGPMKTPSFTELSLDDKAPYTALIPGAYVKPAMTVRVKGYENWKGGIPFMRDIKPVVSLTELNVKLVFVPLQLLNGQIGKVPSEELLRVAIRKYLPVPDNVKITISAPQMIGNNMDTNNDWGRTLSQMSNIRYTLLGWNGDFTTLFYGFTPWNSTGIVGIAYLNSYVSLGIDTNSDSQGGTWESIMTHELGHNLGRPHAPCGGVANPDQDYPYPGGAFGPTPAFDLIRIKEIGTGMADVMGYCGGDYFSDYNYDLVKKEAEKRWKAPSKAEGAIRSAAINSLGFMISIGQEFKLLSKDTIDLGGTETTTAVVDGRVVKATIYRIDHSADVHVWIEGEVGRNISIKIGDTTITGVL